MPNTYRRHKASCKHSSEYDYQNGSIGHGPQYRKGENYMKCKCPIWVDIMVQGKRVRKSLNTFDEQEAARKVLEITAGGGQEDSTVKNAVGDFIEDRKSNNLVDRTIGNYEDMLNHLVQFCETHSITLVRALKYGDFKLFLRALALSNCNRTMRRKIGELRTFTQYCMDMGWRDDNPVLQIKKPKITSAPVVPFTEEEQQAIFAAVAEYPTSPHHRARLLAFILVLRYSALRISDVVKLIPARIKNGRLFLRTTKTGSVVHLVLPPVVLAALAAIENGSSYYFWTGKSLQSGTANWQNKFAKVVARAGVKGHPHMYRHTMACELLANGVPLDQVAAILGNSVAVLEGHYTPWIKSRQDAVDKSVMSTWPITIGGPVAESAPTPA